MVKTIYNLKLNKAIDKYARMLWNKDRAAGGVEGYWSKVPVDAKQPYLTAAKAHVLAKGGHVGVLDVEDEVEALRKRVLALESLLERVQKLIGAQLPTQG